jgi:hypothetical protein
MRLKIVIKIIVLIVVLQSCKGSKSVADDNAMKKENLKAIINQFESSKPQFNTMRGRIKANFKTADIQQNINISYRLKRRDTLWMAAKFAGVFEVAKVMMSPENIEFYERIDNNYFSGDFKLVSAFLGMELTYNEIENLLLAGNIKPLDISISDYEIINDDIIISTNYESGINQIVRIDKNKMTIVDQVLNFKEQQLKIDYNSYQIIDNKYFPEQLSLYANKMEDNVNLILEYKSIKLEDKLRFPFKIPSNFTPIKLE